MINFNKAFTIIELLVAITIMSIVAIGSSNFNFNRLNDKQKSEIYVNDIIVDFEKVRNNSLLGKGIGNTFIIPEKWKIDYTNLGNGNITSYYYEGNPINTWTQYNKKDFKDYNVISKIECTSLDNLDTKTYDNSNIGNPTIEFIGKNIILKCDSDNPKYKKLILTIKYKNNFESKIEINTLVGSIQKIPN